MTSDRPRIQSLLELQEKLLRSQSPFVRHIGSLLATGALDGHLSELADRQIGQLLRDTVDRELRVASPESAICNQASKRLFRSTAGRLENYESPTLQCPKCGNDMLFHVGIDEPDYFECMSLNCDSKQAANPEERG